jgi:signal transduction histidine kinase
MYRDPPDNAVNRSSHAGHDELPFRGEVLLDGSTRRVVADIQQFFSKPRIEKAAMQDERARLGRELHDGLLQSLAGAAIQLEVIARLIATDPDAAKARLRELSLLFGEQQRDLRRWIDSARATPAPAMAPVAELAAAIEKLRQRVARQHGLRVDVVLPEVGSVPRSVGEHVYRIVQEGLTNIGKHARARIARVELRIAIDRVQLVIADDGVGFPFHGTLDLDALQHRCAGPRSITDRVAALKGTLTVASSLSGAQLLVSLPFRSG